MKPEFGCDVKKEVAGGLPWKVHDCLFVMRREKSHHFVMMSAADLRTDFSIFG